jgi:hypothetical protein
MFIPGFLFPTITEMVRMTNPDVSKEYLKIWAILK